MIAVEHIHMTDIRQVGNCFTINLVDVYISFIKDVFLASMVHDIVVNKTARVNN